MGATLCSEVIARAAVLLGDRSHATWTAVELLGWHNDGQNAIVALRPDAKTRVQSLALQAGSRQQIGTPDLRILDVTRNMGTNGDTPGRAIRFINRAELDLEVPDWHIPPAGGDLVVRHWTYDQRTPETWWVYPAQPSAAAQQRVEVITSCVPEPATLADTGGASDTTTMDLADIYVNPLVDFICWRAFSRDSEYTQPGGKAALHLQSFYQQLGVKTTSDKLFRPEKSNPPLFSSPPKGNDGALGDMR